MAKFPNELIQKLDEIKEAIKGESGGGSSDFSTATVTVKYFDTDIPYGFSAVVVDEGVAVAAGVNLKNLGEDWTAPLLVGSAIFLQDAIITATVSDNIEAVGSDMDTYFVVHGSGTITITNVTQLET